MKFDITNLSSDYVLLDSILELTFGTFNSWLGILASLLVCIVTWYVQCTLHVLFS